MKPLLPILFFAFISLLVTNRHSVNIVNSCWKKIETEGEVVGRHKNTFSTRHKWKKLFNGENLTGWQVKCQNKDKGHGWKNGGLILPCLIGK